jgi:hypothetical protein
MAKNNRQPKRILRAKRQSAYSNAARQVGPRQCGLCGSTKKLTRTECCGQWICDDEDQYELFSYARNSCHRNHRRFTLCGGHFEHGHDGKWQECPKCRELMETEMYAYFGTNEYNFETLPNPPAYEPTRCSKCNQVIKLGDGGYSRGRDGYVCIGCLSPELQQLLSMRGR